jgi:hypothetical protein
VGKAASGAPVGSGGVFMDRYLTAAKNPSLNLMRTKELRQDQSKVSVLPSLARLGWFSAY